ncbi:UDP-N-acetylmuramate dehydrogenase [Shewanella surugensis]|uniref:UDP-N-acetylenolpyruvoylglucosamine reductase n=2 Tax=Shewanella surugensis TaxID=212020 RepID=A0ABT0LDL5_9GAMM|nr:UDP-N-acetylmuramate dehydrogenase [Shewanella surugensis]
MKSSASLKAYNTFGIDHACMSLHEISDKAELISTCLELYRQDLPVLILGGGSNIVLVDDYQGHVVRILTKGIKIEEDETYFYLRVEAGENWHDLVSLCVDNDIGGIENLALIPGTVGAAPIQNIGAYGIEFGDICDWVEYLDLSSGELKCLSGFECHFTYRESIFKGKLKGQVMITAVGIKLAKEWQPILAYGPLSSLAKGGIEPRHVFDYVCQLRREKLPDPLVLGNAGSFFKNPVVPVATFERLRDHYPDIVAFQMGSQEMKLAAAWLIDKAGLKGMSCADASVHEQQALVLVNNGAATGRDVCQLADLIIDRIVQLFGIQLEPEPRIIGATGEINKG